MTPADRPAGSPLGLRRRLWTGTVATTGREILDDHVLQWAAALTFFGVLALFPAMLALVSVLGLVGGSALEPLIQNASELAPGTARDIALGALESIKSSEDEAGLAFALGLGAALWSSSAYVGAFIPAANVTWEVDEARPWLAKLVVRAALTVSLLFLVAVTASTVVLTGPIAGGARRPRRTRIRGCGSLVLPEVAVSRGGRHGDSVHALLGVAQRAASRRELDRAG